MATLSGSAAPPAVSTHSVTRLARQVVVYALLIGGGVLFAFPFYWLVITSLKAEHMVLADPPQWWPDPLAVQNYADLFGAGPVFNWIRNSVIVAVLGALFYTASSVLTAYGFARLPFPGSRALFFLVLATLMLPGHVTIIPRFVLFRELKWLDTLLPLIVPTLFGSAFYIFLMRQFFLTLPRELDEAAELDGANSFQILWHVLLPLCGPATATVAVFAFVSQWSDFLEPFIYLSTPENLTLQVGLRWFNTQYGTRFHLMMAGAVIAMLPILVVFFVAQKQFVQGIALTGMKG
ncbi:MAG TPA: carbohydrate ABC transporter permease [Chloroflexota bacterium]|jgi:ABC-type glycerol-3-phosphate transport system permease component|nr:carbohydrate ABC transporter permease [Chloroflexota bacterium]